ncbi:hypothetical protein KCU65_g8716, partial [Aureobasidium melanogenum]
MSTDEEQRMERVVLYLPNNYFAKHPTIEHDCRLALMVAMEQLDRAVADHNISPVDAALAREFLIQNAMLKNLSMSSFEQQIGTSIGRPQTTSLGHPQTIFLGHPLTIFPGHPLTTSIGRPQTTSLGRPQTTSLGRSMAVEPATGPGSNTDVEIDPARNNVITNKPAANMMIHQKHN